MMARLSTTALALLAGATLVALPAAAQTVDFGADSSIWANDGECDDPRFIGEGMSADPQEADIGADASDCAAAFDAGRVTLDPAMADAQVPADRPAKPGTAVASDPGEIDFGSDTSPWANDGECDDPRFEGEGMSPQPQDSDIMADATDCRMLYEAFSVEYVATGQDQPAKPAVGGIDFGADTSAWAKDGECDDPRFTGQGMSSQPQDSDMFADATDCRTLFDAGSIQFAGDGGMGGMDAASAAVDFGADTGTWVNNGECDDPRFEGEGMSDVLLDEDRFADATDCRALFESGLIRLVDAAAAPTDDAGAVDFGADSGEWTNDGECDDPRFEGEGMAEILVDADLFADATDCRTLYETGMIQLVGEAPAASEIDFGTDTGKWSNDGECDDPRFNGEGMSEVLLDDFRFADATDCRNLYEAGKLSYLGD